MAGKLSERITAEARVVRAAALYLGFDTNVSSPGPACSIPFRPVISESGDPFSRRRLRAEAMAESFMSKNEGATKSYTNAGPGHDRLVCSLCGGLTAYEFGFLLDR